MKLMAAIQKMKKVNPTSTSQIQSKSSTVTNSNQSVTSNKVVNVPNQQQLIHKKNSKSQTGQANIPTKQPQSVTANQARQAAHYHSIGTTSADTTNSNPPLSEQYRETTQGRNQSILDADLQNNSIISLASENLNSSIKNMTKGKPTAPASSSGEKASSSIRSKEGTISNQGTL
jgi:hypothetical protein